MKTPVWFRLIGSPVRNFVSDDDALPFIAPGEAVHRLLNDVGVLRSDSNGETPNITIALQNDEDQLTTLYRLAQPPLGSIGEIRSPAGVLYAGQVKSFALEDTCNVGLQT